MNDDQLLRYSRQILLPEFGTEGQQRLLNARVLLIGCGGLGSPVAMYLASAGVGHIVICDFDHVDLSNLQRQIAHQQDDIGRNKAHSMSATLSALNPDIKIDIIDTRMDDEQLSSEVEKADVVIDASDNFATRYQINNACVDHQTPLVSGAAIRMEGQVTVFRNQGGACYRCLYRDGIEEEQRCSENGVLSPLVGIIGSIQATETIKLITNIGQILEDRLMILDAATMECRTIKLPKDPSCPCCGSND